jgi:hypothetical protein
MLGYDFPLLSLFWTMLMFFLFFGWIILVFHVFADIFRSHDIGGGAKALWLIVVLVLPFLGSLIYVIVRGHGMSDRYNRISPTQDEALRSYVQVTSATGGSL